MASNQTPNLGLSQWQRTDPFTMDEFNADYAKIDAALGAQPYKVLLRQTLATQSPRFSIDLSGIDFTEYPRVRLELMGKAVGPSAWGSDVFGAWCNSISSGYYSRNITNSNNVTEESYLNLGYVSYDTDGHSLIALTMDIMPWEYGICFRDQMSAFALKADGFYGFNGYDTYACCLALAPEDFHTLHIGSTKYTEGSCVKWLPGTTAMLFSVG